MRKEKTVPPVSPGFLIPLFCNPISYPMPVANFYLKEPGASVDTLIYLVYHMGGQKLKYSTGQKISPRFWNPEKQRVKETRQFPGHVELNVLLNNIESAAHNAFRKLVNM